jgi:hypothetical protein
VKIGIYPFTSLSIEPDTKKTQIGLKGGAMPLKPKAYGLICEDDVKSAFEELFPKAFFYLWRFLFSRA